jgi:hypothetical protein
MSHKYQAAERRHLDSIASAYATRNPDGEIRNAAAPRLFPGSASFPRLTPTAHAVGYVDAAAPRLFGVTRDPNLFVERDRRAREYRS